MGVLIALLYLLGSVFLLLGSLLNFIVQLK